MSIIRNEIPDTAFGTSELYALVVALCATAVYAMAAWYISGIWSTLVADQVNVSMFSAVTVRPLDLPVEFGMLHWQLFALLSLLLHGFWGSRRSTTLAADGFALPLLCHFAWLFTAFLLHVCGLLVSFVSICHVLA